MTYIGKDIFRLELLLKGERQGAYRTYVMFGGGDGRIARRSMLWRQGRISESGDQTHKHYRDRLLDLPLCPI